MSIDIKKEGMIYPDGITTPKEAIEYVASVYGIKDNENGLLFETFRKLCALSVSAQYDGWFEDYFDEWINKKV